MVRTRAIRQRHGAALKRDCKPAMSAKKRGDSSTTRELILAAALKLVSRSGYAGTSIAMICQEAGLNASSLYWFFDNKEDLFLSLIKESADEFLRSLALPAASSVAPIRK